MFTIYSKSVGGRKYDRTIRLETDKQNRRIQH